MKVFTKIKAQAMQFALLISVIIAVLLSAFLLLTHVQSFFRIKSGEIINSIELTNQQIFESLEDQKTSNDTILISGDSKRQKLVSTYYGAWVKVFSTVEIHHRKTSQIAFTGSIADTKTPNLYLANTNSPLVVVGSTRLEGNSYLPKQGIKAGNISGNYYQGSSLYYGRTIESKERIPELDSKWLSYIASLIQETYIEEDHIIPLEKEIKNSFYNPQKIIYNTEAIILGDEKISGNIIIQSKSKIVVSSASQLTDVILIAPSIEIKDGVKGIFQSIASKKIKIGKRCYLSYPSSITLVDRNSVTTTNQGNTSQNKTPDFTIDKNTTIEGSVIYLKKKQEIQNRIKTHLKVETNVLIIGEVYCQGNIEFLGTVKGSLYTRQFIANQSGSVYLNHLYNGKVLANPIPEYAGLPFSNTKNSIAKWLY